MADKLAEPFPSKLFAGSVKCLNCDATVDMFAAVHSRDSKGCPIIEQERWGKCEACKREMCGKLLPAR